MIRATLQTRKNDETWRRHLGGHKGMAQITTNTMRAESRARTGRPHKRRNQPIRAEGHVGYGWRGGGHKPGSHMRLLRVVNSICDSVTGRGEKEERGRGE